MNNSNRKENSSLKVLKKLLSYLLKYKLRMGFALLSLVLAKIANVGIPILLKEIVDHLTTLELEKKSVEDLKGIIAVPAVLIIGYGLMRFASTAFAELRELIFARVTQSSVRDISVQVFSHLHNLSLRFHLEKKTGSLTRDIERGTRGISTMVNFTLYSIFPTFVEVILVIGWLSINYDPIFSLITFAALVLYISYTILVTNWRTHLRRTMNELDSKANSGAIDSLMNYETVKFFNNESYELNRYDENLLKWQEAAIKSQSSLAFLNIGQALIVAIAVTLIVWQAIEGVLSNQLTLGDLVLINAFMIQLYIPLNFLGVLYREIKQSIADMEKLFSLLEKQTEVTDGPDASSLIISKGQLIFETVSFAYDYRRSILKELSFELMPGKTTAIVGKSGAGKSTLSKLIYRFYEVGKGTIKIDGQNIKDVTQSSLRSKIGIVPQDIVLFNDSLKNNIKYGNITASTEEIIKVVNAAHLESLVDSLPDGIETVVGERGLKLSGGEKQRVAIARVLLKKPAILIFDEATSALDTVSEKAIKSEIREISKGRTSLIIAHRLSTIVDADMIYVFDKGRIVEKGSHEQLIKKNGHYLELWTMQAQVKEI
jgi:ATP-binding cassette subfamily B protein